MKLKIFFILLITTVILMGFTSSCSRTGNTIVGRGIQLSFEGELPTELYENQEFSFKLKAQNYGPTPVSGTLCLSDLLTQYGGIPSNECQFVNLEPAFQSDGKISPAEMEFQFPISGGYVYTNINAQEGIDESTAITATFSYQTQTKALAGVCIKSLNAQIKDCSNTETITDIKQGDMPIEVRKIEKIAVPSSDNKVSVSLKIYLEQMEEGTIIDPQSINQGKTLLSPFITFLAIYGNNPLKCSVESGNKVRFVTGNEKMVLCTATVPLSQDLIKDTLVITLGYGFQTKAGPIAITLKKTQEVM